MPDNGAVLRDARFTRKDRLTGEENFTKVLQSKFRSWGEHLIVLAIPNDLPNARLGLVVPKKYARKSTDRNRLKRLVRESFRQHKHEFPGLDIVVIATKGSDSLTNRQITCTLERHWRKLIRCKHS